MEKTIDQLRKEKLVIETQIKEIEKNEEVINLKKHYDYFIESYKLSPSKPFYVVKVSSYEEGNLAFKICKLKFNEETFFLNDNKKMKDKEYLYKANLSYLESSKLYPTVDGNMIFEKYTNNHDVELYTKDFLFYGVYLTTLYCRVDDIFPDYLTAESFINNKIKERCDEITNPHLKRLEDSKKFLNKNKF